MDKIVKLMLNKTNVVLLAKIDNVRNNQYVDATPQSEYKGIPMPRINKIPMLQLGNLKININVQFNVGDIVPLLISSDDIGSFIREESITNESSRKHHLNNAIALPFLIPTDVNSYQMPRDILINGNGVWNGNVTINGNVKINGNLDVSGVSTANNHMSGGISGNSHTHKGDSGGNTGTPQ